MSHSSVLFVIMLIMVLGVALTIAALINIMQTPALDQTNRIIWVLIVLVLPVIGAIAWFIARPKKPTNPPEDGFISH